MQLSDSTITVLKSLAGINPSLVIRPGNVLRTINPVKTVMAQVEIEDEFPADACIYDMSRLLSVLGLFDKPEIEFDEKFLTIKEGKRAVRYMFAAPDMVITPPAKDPQMPPVDVTFDLTWADLQSVLKAAGVLGLPQIAFIGNGETITLSAIDAGNDGCDTFGVEVGETEDTFRMILLTENIKLLPKDYTVELSSVGLTKFTAPDAHYFVALEQNSTYEK